MLYLLNGGINITSFILRVCLYYLLPYSMCV